jgi:hypothetical protein
VAKVKKGAGVTGVRNVKTRKRAKPPVGKSKRKGTTRTLPATKGRKGKAGGKIMGKVAKKVASRTIAKAASRSGRKAPDPMPVVRVAIRELDPQRKCGEGTSVQFLYRVDETVDGRATAHLVFFDRHGWYCEHGRTCPAVAHARKHNGHIARAS